MTVERLRYDVEVEYRWDDKQGGQSENFPTDHPTMSYWQIVCGGPGTIQVTTFDKDGIDPSTGGPAPDPIPSNYIAHMGQFTIQPGTELNVVAVKVKLTNLGTVLVPLARTTAIVKARVSKSPVAPH